MIEGVIFDLGETLLRFEGDWQAVFAASRARLIQFLLPRVGQFDEAQFDQRFRLAIETAQQDREEDLRERPLAGILANTLAELQLDSLDRDTMDRAMEVMFAPSEAAWTPIPGVDEVLIEIRELGVEMGLISNASDAPNVYRLIEKAAIGPYFDPILVSAAHGWRKPAEEIFQDVLDQWKLPPDRVVMVGDTLGADILGAQRMGMHQIWFRSAADREDNLAVQDAVKPEEVVDSLAQVPAVIAALHGQTV